MREIKFRGKAIMSTEELELIGIEHDNGWVYGNLIKNGNRPIISADILEEIDESIYPEWWVVVEHESVGQYTGLKDENGRDIYEGDVIKGTYYDNLYKTKKEVICQVRWDKSGYWTFSGAINFSGGYLSDLRNIIVIGNVYENPELLVVEGK